MMAVRKARNHQGFSRLELMVAVLVVGILAAILLDRLHFYQEFAEKARMEYTINRFKSGLRLRMATMLVAGRAQEYGALAEQNPVEWLDGNLENYAGEMESGNAAGNVPGRWYFDRANRMLVYQVQHGTYFQPDSNGQKQVRLKVMVVRNGGDSLGNIKNNDPSASVAIKLVENYKWF